MMMMMMMGHHSFTSFMLPLATLALAVVGTLSKKSCQSDSFSALIPDALPGASITNIESEYLSKKSFPARPPYFPQYTVKETCQVNVHYTYPNTSTPEIKITIWLPDQWNERFVGTGGGGFQATMGIPSLYLPNHDGFAAVTTDGGLTGEPFHSTYLLRSPGNVNKDAIERLGYRAIHEMTVIGKKVVESYYGRKPKTNIFTGCSTGGRQAVMEASRYPEDYDGIVAGAPAVRWNDLIGMHLSAQAAMASANYVPSPCEMMAITQAAIKECDGLDGVVDGIVSRPDLCKFHPNAAIGDEYPVDCEEEKSTGKTAKVTSEGAKVIQLLMAGVFASDGEKLHPGYPWGSMVWMANSAGSSQKKGTTGDRTIAPFPLVRQWAEEVILAGLGSLTSFDFNRLTVDEAQAFIHHSKAQFDYILDPSPDLSKFANRGGKLLTYHGLEDEIIPVANTLQKYSDVQQTMFPRLTSAAGIEAMHDFWRVFLLPGVQHCTIYPGKKGGTAGDAYRSLVSWVEDGMAPQRLKSFNAVQGSTFAETCLWPSKPLWTDGILDCRSGLSIWDSFPSAAELMTQFMEHLPGWLFLNPKSEL